MFDFNHRSFIWGPTLCGAVLAVASCGCDLGTYEGRYRDRLPELQRRSEASQQIHAGYTSLEAADGRSLGAQLRFPVLFDGETTRYSAEDLASKPSQAQPPQIPIPGLLFTYEKYVTQEGGEALPVYAYVGSADAAVELEALAQEIEQSVEAVVPDDLRWQTVSLKTLSGEAVTWQLLRVSAAQPFMVRNSAGEEKSQSLEGQLLIFVKTLGNQHAILAWRYPSQMADQINFPKGIEASVASMK